LSCDNERSPFRLGQQYRFSSEEKWSREEVKEAGLEMLIPNELSAVGLQPPARADSIPAHCREVR
jgi:hypothetical protein